MVGKKRRIRVANELPKTRRLAIKKALDEHESAARPEWDRASEWNDIRFLRKKVKTGEMRTIMMPLLDVDMGDSWPIPVTIFHGVRPGPVITLSLIHI